MLRASLELAVIAAFSAVVIAWCDFGGAIVTLARLGGW